MNLSKLHIFLFFAYNIILHKTILNAEEESNQKEIASDRPNILYFLIDDWGYNDVGYYGNTDTDTPFINELVKHESLRLDKYYVMPECTATRCALLTGRYPIRYGMQDGILYYQSSYALTRRETLLSNEFQNQGYRTHIVGKWHLGMMADVYTPTYRGFDTFLGFYAGLIHYYTHYGIESSYPYKVDFHDGEDGYNENMVYTMFTYKDRILNIIDDSLEEEDPFFMYVGWQGSHSPSEAPDEYKAKYAAQEDDNRLHFQAQTTLTDDVLREIVTYLKSTGVWDNTLMIVASDNGADYGYGDNSPLRGSKFTLWEGGIRVPAFVTGGYLPEERKGSYIDDIPIHVTDWYPTLLKAANLNVETPNKLDGLDVWKYINDGTTPVENEYLDDRYILLNADEYGCATDVCGAILYGGKWKLLTGTNQVVSFETGSAEKETCFWHRDFSIDESMDRLACGMVPDDVDTDTCGCQKTLCLFDLENDPCEYTDVYDEYPDIGEMLYAKLAEYHDSQALVLFDNTFNIATSIAAKNNMGGYWEPWVDLENDYDGQWENLRFEGLLDDYYDDGNVNSEDDSEQDSKESFMSWVHSQNWSKLLLIIIGVLISSVSLFGILRYWCQCCRARIKTINDEVSNNSVNVTGDERTPLAQAGVFNNYW